MNSLSRCQACLFTFNSPHLLREHLARSRRDGMHDISDPMYECCQRDFNYEALCHHLDFEHLGHDDDRRASLLKTTKVVAAKHQCETCSKCFIRRYDLTRHKRIHDGEMPYKCDMCQRSFTLKCTLQRHVKTHEEEEKETFECEVCKGIFLYRSSLRMHMRQHTGESPFQCKSAHCQRRFRTKKDMLTHHKRCSTDTMAKMPSAAIPSHRKITRAMAGMSGPATVQLPIHHSSAFTRVEKGGRLAVTNSSTSATPVAAAVTTTASTSDSHVISGHPDNDWRPLKIFVRVQLRTGSLPAGAATTLAHVAVDVSNLEKLASDNVRIEVPIRQNVLPFGLTLSADSRKLLDRINSLGVPLTTTQPQSFSFIVYPTLQHVAPPPATFNISSPFCILISREDYARIRHNMPSFLIDSQCEYWRGKEVGLQSHYRHIQAQSCLPVL